MHDLFVKNIIFHHLIIFIFIYLNFRIEGLGIGFEGKEKTYLVRLANYICGVLFTTSTDYKRDFFVFYI